MRRWRTRILICLILGAVTTVAVAWTFAWRLDRIDSWGARRVLGAEPDTDGIRWGIWRDEHDGTTILTCIRISLGDEYLKNEFGDFILELGEVGDLVARAPRWARKTIQRRVEIFKAGDPVFAHISDADVWEWQVVMGHGWPFRSLSCEFLLPGNQMMAITYGGLETDGEPLLYGIMQTQGIPRALPVRPIWLGFVANSVLYGAPWIVLLIGASTARRAFRKRRGLCPMCAYNLRGGAMGPAGSRASPLGCPECGWNRSDDQPPGDDGD